MVRLIVALVIGFVFIAATFYVPFVAIFLGGILAGLVARNAGLGLIAGGAAGAIVGAVIHFIPQNWTWDWAQVFSDPVLHQLICAEELGTLTTWPTILNWFTTTGGCYVWFIVVCGVLGLIGGLIGGVARRT